MNTDVVREVFGEVVVMIPKNRLLYMTTVLNTLIDDMEDHEDDVPYAFLSEGLLYSTNRVKRVLYDHTVPIEDFADMDTTGKIIISYEDFGNIEHHFGPVIGWARYRIHKKEDLEYDKILSWTQYLKNVRNILKLRELITIQLHPNSHCSR